MQNVKLVQFKNENTNTSKASVKEIDLLKTKLKTLHSSMEEEKAKTLNLITLRQKQLRYKDKQIQTLQYQLAIHQLTTISFENKTYGTTVPKEITKKASKSKHIFKCADCGFVDMDTGGL